MKSGQPKENSIMIIGTKGLPKGPKGYGSRKTVVLNSNNRRPTITSSLIQNGKRSRVLSPIINTGRVLGINVRSINNSAGGSSTVSTDGVAKLRKIHVLCRQNPNFIVTDKIYRLLYEPALYEIAYDKLKRGKPPSCGGNMTLPPLGPPGGVGINSTTLDGMSKEVIEDIIKQMRVGTFKFSPGRINIPKPRFAGGTRPLTIAPPRDKLVQEVMRMILEAIFEPSFSDYSHGFRPGKSCHSALKDVKTKFGVAT